MSGIIGGIFGTGAIGGGFAERFLRPASLRGQGFWINTSEDEPGQRWVTHEFPGRDDPWHEPLGRKTLAFGIEGLLIGDDVVQQANAFRTAVDAPEAARLVHPWYGELDVVVIDCRIHFDQQEGRVARIGLKVQKAGDLPAPDFLGDFVAGVQRRIGALTTAVLAQVTRLRSLVGSASHVLSAAAGIVAGLAGAMRGALSGAGLAGLLSGGPVAVAIDALGLLGEDAADPVKAQAAIAAAARAIAAEAGGVAKADEATTSDGRPQEVFAALLALAIANLVPVPAPDGSSGGALISEGAQNLAKLAAIAVAMEIARVAPTVPFASRDEAIIARDRLADVLDAAMDRAGAAGWDDCWREMAALRAAAITEISERAAPLPRIVTVTLPATLPASLLAYRLDGDALGDVFERGARIALRNKARHPGFLPAGVPLELLV
jgi:prophage DNA circulation protein